MAGKQDDWRDLSGYLYVRLNIKGRKKLKPSKKKLWCIFDQPSNQLQCYKSAKDALVKGPLESINLQGASLYFQNAEVCEFVINVNGKEYLFMADNHDRMMMWLKGLQDQLSTDDAEPSIQRARSLDFDTVTRDEDYVQKPTQFSMSLVDLNENAKPGRPRKRRFIRFLPWSFRRHRTAEKGSVDNKWDSEKSATMKEIRKNGEISPSERRRTWSGKKSGCKTCASHISHNVFLNNEVQKLTDKVHEEEQKMKEKERTIEELEKENLQLKKEMISVIQDCLVKEEESDDSMLEYFRYRDHVLDMLEEARTINRSLPQYDRSSTSTYEDNLGFVHGTRESPIQVFQYLCQELRQHYSDKLQESTILKEWDSYLQRTKNSEELQVDDTLKRLVINGVPHKHRREVWKKLVAARVKHVKTKKAKCVVLILFVSGLETLIFDPRPVKKAKRSQGADYFDQLCKQLPDLQNTEAEDDDSIEKQVRVDLLRTLPTHTDFKSLESDGVIKLHRVLRAYLLHNPEIGYCQGMNFMVGIALLYLDEEDAFWLLVAITEVYFGPKHYNHYLCGSQADQKVLEELAAQKIPVVMECMKEKGCELSPITFNWLMTIFIDSVPVEVVLRIWDCFLLEGHQVIYRFGLAILQIYQSDVYKAKDSLAIMRHLKRLGRQTYDADYLVQIAYNDFEPFLSKDTLLKMYQKHFSVIEEHHKKREEQDKEYERERKMKRFAPKTISVTVDQDLNELAEDMMIECAEPEANPNSVWLCCSTHETGKLFVMDIVNRSLDMVKKEIESRCLCMARSPTTNTMIIGTANASLHGFDIKKREEVWKLQVDDSVSSISCDSSANIVTTLASGSIAIAEHKAGDPKPSRPIYIHIGRAAVSCGCIDGNYFWCGCGNNIVIIDTSTLDEVESIQVCPNLRHSVAKLLVSDQGIWCSVRGSSVLQLFDRKTFTCLVTTDVLDESGLASEKISHLSSTRITSILPRRSEIWVGLGNGRFLIFDIKSGPKPAESPSSPNPEDPSRLESEIVVSDEEEGNEEQTRDRRVSSPIDIQSQGPMCCHETVRRENTHLSQFSLGDSGFVFIAKGNTAAGANVVPDRYHVELKQLQRISEEAIRCLLCVRNDRKLILSCAGAVNDDLSIILWSCEKREGKEMWYAQTVSYSLRDDRYTSLKDVSQ